MKHENHYPKNIQDYANDIVEYLNNDINEQGENFFIEQKMNEDIFFEEVCKECMAKFVAGVDNVILSEDEFLDVMKRSIVSTVLQNLKKEGLVDMIDVDNDNTMVFLTKKGKNFKTKKIKNI